ncbi:tyrosine-type recombinase/integrase [Hydrogenimonas urashimensis]|uniref:tyrosine-type recombinase/integrase n=1 Tax=Hydrogenimonas urashimensis TaxID=2740515 RepID=UPI0019156816|nr:tyrosine-type recombinase/integrase [Hydrogenimonas urashimensis]
MRYPLDCEDRFERTLLFWMSRYMHSKLNSLSNRQVKDSQALARIIGRLRRGVDSIETLSRLSKEARNAGLIGINTYYKPLEKLYGYLAAMGPASMKEIDEELLSDFLASATAGLSDATKKNYRIAMINFFGYIDKQNAEKDGSAHHFGIELKNWGGLGGKSGTKLPAYMQEAEVERFIEAIETHPFQRAVAARNRMLIKLILFTGIRVGEALQLKTKDLIPEGEVYLIRIVGKGNKARVVMIKQSHIKKYLQEWLLLRKCDGDLLFCNKKGTLLTQAYVSRIVEKILMQAGIRKEKNGAHMLRHTFATMLYLKKKDLVLVQEALGHASLDTSRIYTHFDKERLREAASVMDEIAKDAE